ncbi:MAG: Acetoin(Diacetyl) reductase [Candidatus Tokpelaia hoelldobleri]|uniref:Diacetyl reductase [(S)-acetoin forming] n=1 Tax=Candidatus Tokpelaia hoelldobleri TaxID=1902579 RepID=A0A1U9JTD4_9HYPH|nr:MAG: Acetoin(Diacetyl) reductase [Candidatus Tokpelaia hoelldoblerii]
MTNAKVALVTGSGQGIGRAIALRLAKDGFNTGLVDIKKGKVETVAREIEALGRKAAIHVADTSRQDEVYAAIDHTEKALGGFDVMINNAGIAQVNPLSDVTPEEFNRIVQINIAGVLWGIQAAAKKFIARKQKGKIISASSIAGYEGSAMLGVYSATKFAVRGLTQAAAKEYGHAGITVNAYCPGIVSTDMWTEIDKRLAAITGAPIGDTLVEYSRKIPLGRIQEPEDIANLVAFLASEDSDYITGQAILTTGGLVCR